MLVRELEALDAIDKASSSDSSLARFAFSLDPAFEPSFQQIVDFQNSV